MDAGGQKRKASVIVMASKIRFWIVQITSLAIPFMTLHEAP